MGGVFLVQAKRERGGLTMLYRKKPVVIEAVKFLGVDHKPDSFGERPKWLTDAMYKDYSVRFFGTPQELDIETMEGAMQCSKGDYIIRGVHGELYPCKPDIFKETYEGVDDD